MWSENKKIDLVINILIFLIALNFLYYGQLFLPVICLIIFIDNKFKFKVRNIWAFVVICLFSISFFVFSTKNFYCVMGFTLPMAYYIGSNIKDNSESNLIKLIYIICFGMICHILLNFASDLFINGLAAFKMASRYDFWYGDIMASTIIAVLYTIPIATIYYLVYNETNKKIKHIGIVLFILIMVYEIMLGRRTPILMLIIALLLPMLLSNIMLKEKKVHPVIFVIIGLIVAMIIYLSCFFKFEPTKFYFFVREIPLLYKFLTYKIDPERINIVINAVKLIPGHLWGGQEISGIMDSQIHEFWLDILDYAGIVTYFLMILYTFHNVKSLFKIYKNDKVSKKFKILVITLSVCIIIQMFLEPIMTNSSIFLICVIIILESIYSLNNA